LDIKAFDIEEFKDFNAKLERGDVKLNISATTLIFEVFQKIIKHILESLDNLEGKREIGDIDMKAFVAAYLKLDIAEYILYSAFQAP
jgi:hypothetical protein